LKSTQISQGKNCDIQRGDTYLANFDPCASTNLKDPQFDSLSDEQREIENLHCLRSVSFVCRSVRVSVAGSFLLSAKINQNQFNALLAEEIVVRSTSATTTSAPKKDSSSITQLAKKERLRYLGLLLHHDHKTATLLVKTAPISPPDTDNDMKE
jgi:hypothetical protein